MSSLPPFPTPGSRPAPRGDKSRQRVQGLLAAARSVFSEHGYQRATTAQIADVAGVSEATVFTYFPSKQALCTQVITDWYDEISGALEQELPRCQGLHAQLAHVVSQHLHTLLADGSGLCALVLSEGRAQAAELAPVLQACKRRYTQPLMNCLAQARRRGEIRQDMPLRLLRDLVYGSMEHVLWDSIQTRRRPNIASTAEQLTALIWSALQPRDASLDALQRFQDEVRAALRRADQSGDKPSCGRPLSLA